MSTLRERRHRARLTWALMPHDAQRERCALVLGVLLGPPRTAPVRVVLRRLHRHPLTSGEQRSSDVVFRAALDAVVQWAGVAPPEGHSIEHQRALVDAIEIEVVCLEASHAA